MCATSALPFSPTLTPTLTPAPVALDTVSRAGITALLRAYAAVDDVHGFMSAWVSVQKPKPEHCVVAFKFMGVCAVHEEAVV
jgi:hypothetical protein